MVVHDGPNAPSPAATLSPIDAVVLDRGEPNGCEYPMETTQRRLLEAAERILIEQGVHALTVRRVGAVADVNPTLVTYHFKSISGLLAELCRMNLEPMQAEWKELDRPGIEGLNELLTIWLRPLLRPSAFVADGRALIVLVEIGAHGTADIANHIIEATLALSARLQERLAPYLPHLDRRELRARLRFISGAAIGPPPRARGSARTEEEQSLESFDYFMAFAKAALR